jgi:hypothetical protein
MGQDDGEQLEKKESAERKRPRTRLKHVRLSHSSSISASSSSYAPSIQSLLFPQSDALCSARIWLALRPSSCSARRLASHAGTAQMCASESGQPAVLTLALWMERVRDGKSDVIFITPPSVRHRPSFCPAFVFLSSYPPYSHCLRCKKTAQARRGYD